MKNKKIYLEILRVLAIFLVLYNHTGRDAILRYTAAGNSFSCILSLILLCVCSPCNMIFFMISGALLLRKEESATAVFKKRVLKMLIVLILFSLMQYGYQIYQNPGISFNLPAFLRVIYSSPIITQYWFLYAYLGFLLMLPFLRILVRHMNPYHYLYLIGLYLFIEGILPIAERLLNYGSLGIDFPFLVSIIFFPILGYFLECIAWDFCSQKHSLLVINLLASITLAVNIYQEYLALKAGASVLPLNGLTMILAGTLYLDVRFLCTRFSMPRVSQKIWTFLGNGTFGVYLLDTQLRDAFHFIYTALEPYIKWLPASFIWLTAAMLTGILITNLLKKIPLVRKLF